MTIEERLVAKCGTTEVPELASWLLADGTLVNGSYEGFQRDMDHREISEFFKASKRAKPGSAFLYVQKFIRRGNIRLCCSTTDYCAEYAVTPTEGQLRVLCRLMERGMRMGRNTYVEKMNPSGAGNPVSWPYPEFIRHLYRHTHASIPSGSLIYAYDPDYR